jgi:hypothetical protein
MSLKSVSAETMRKAAAFGKVPKPPKKPKKSASITTLENYIARHNAWAKRVHDMASQGAKEASLRKTIFGHS